MSMALRRAGGTWRTLARNPDAKPLLEQALGDTVGVFDGQSLPYEDKFFDVVVIADFLERIIEDSALITECHRVIKPGGRLLVSVPHAKQFAPMHSIQHVLGLTPGKLGMARQGYSETELFQLLKHGFDVHTVRSHTKLFVEIVDTIARLLALRLERTNGTAEQLVALYSRTYPFYWIAFQFDFFLFFMKGCRLAAVAKRHLWRSRTAPVLNDGRSISEVVLSKVRE